MTLQEIIDQLDLKLLTDERDFTQMEPSGGYASDLLSCVMAGAMHKGLWVTLQSHGNIVAVASLLELSAIIITEGALPDLATIEKAREEKVTLLSTPNSNFEIAGKLWEMGIRSN